MLQGKDVDGIKLEDFLAKAVEPPPATSIKNAIKTLEDIGALEPGSEALTSMGRSLAAMPLPPRLGKMLLYGILFSMLDPLLTIACFISYRYQTHLAQSCYI